MSSKSSLRSARSMTSSAGETHVSSHSSGSSIRHRRGRATAYAEPRLPPAVMSASERLDLIRCSVTRLQYVCERQLHMQTLDQAGGPPVDAFFDKLRRRLETMQHPPSSRIVVDTGNNRTDVQPTLATPTQLQRMAQTVAKLREAAEQVRQVIIASQARDGGAVAVYAGLKEHLLQEAITELAELDQLVTHRPHEMTSRIDTTLLADLVAFHVDDFDAFATQRVLHFLQEAKDEGAFYAGAVMTDASQRASPLGIASVVVLDVAIGVRPGRCARIVLEHARQRLTRVDNRLQSADAVLHEADGAPTDQATDTTRRLTYELQRREYSVMKERMRQALSELDALAQRWEAEELAIFDRATAGSHDLDTVWQTKQLKEAEVVEEVQAIHDRALHVCLPFASPQYHRRYAETYSQPCHIRIGFHFIAGEGEGGGGAAEAMRATGANDALHDDETAGRGPGSLMVYTAMPGFLPWMRQRRVPVSAYERYAYLVPSKEQFWLSFSDFPEMVKGARCVLRDVHHRLDHFRATEETKEVGGYFIMRGGERILRALLMQRCNVPVNIQRERFQTQGPHFSSKAVVIRCKRPSGLTVQNYFYYITVGDAVFSFARKVVWHIPVTLLLFATSTRNVTGLELYKLLTVGMPAGNHAARVEAMMQHHQERPYSTLCHYVDYLTVLGRMYREYHEQSNTFHFLPQFVTGLRCQHDAWYGLFMLRRHVLPHLNRAVATPDLSPTATAAQLADWLPPTLREELDRKFDVLLAILRQLYLFVDGAVQHQGNDVPAYQEIFTVSQVLVGAFEVCLNKYLRGFAYRFGRHLPATLFRHIQALPLVASKDAEDTMRQLRELSEYCARRSGGDPLDLLHRLLTTGNLSLDREEDFYCPQTSGWVVMAEHLNFYRFFEQLRCVHRGKTIAEMRSSEVRKYPCEAYGYICMVHSPDGEDCGVLNHLSVSTIMSSSMAAQSEQRTQLRTWLQELLPNLHVFRTAAYTTAGASNSTSTVEELLCSVPVWVEGELFGYVAPAAAARAALALRERKALTEQALVTVHGIVRRHNVSSLHTVEVVYVAPENKDPAGLYIFYDCGRLMRPVQQIESGTFTHHPGLDVTVPSTPSQLLPFPLVFIGTWEQTWLDVASVPSDLLDGVVQLNRKYQYMEQNGSNLISLTATTIPFFEYNCSPRNLFQCGLSKQSAGTQLQALAWRKEAKLFRMYTPQRYISRTLSMDAYNLDEVNLGVNAVVAILAYTGYDMDDAVILNHTAAQRGMLTAGVTVAKVITASGHGEKDDVFVFHNLLSTGERFSAELGRDGLPLRRANPQLDGFNFDTDHKYPALQSNSDVYCCAKRVERVDLITNQKVYEYTRHHTTKWRHFDKGENAWVHSVVPLAYSGSDPTTVLVVFRIPRPPNVGDKFSSRHGQKGTLPLHIRAPDLPFASVTGIVPDVIINPHAFPSRMTVGMVLEIMAGKVGAVEGRFMDNSAWSTVDATPRVAEVIGEALLRSGYNRYGRETLIDGISGETMEAEVFMGISGYQRLRHMVSDKWQARARTDAHTFRAVTKTGQPVKGRKRHGGVRVGEMERDGLLSHGISEVVLDRLLHVSDKTKAFICPECGSLLSIYERHATEYSTWKTCRFCGAGTEESSDTIAMVEIPQVLRLWAAELTSIGIRVALQTDEATSLS